MLPHINREQRGEVFSDGISGVMLRRDNELAVTILSEPDPSGTEVSRSGLSELGLELIEAAEVPVDELSNLPGGGTSSAGFEAVPVEGMVPNLG